MNQRQALPRVLEFAGRHCEGDGDNKTVARAAFTILWLEDINWHSEATALADKTRATPLLRAAYEKLERDEIRMGELHDAATLFTWIFGYGLKTDGWRSTEGAPLVEEFWGIITALPESRRRHEHNTIPR